MSEQFNDAIQFIDLKKQQELIKDKIDIAIAKVLDHGMYVLGPEVTELEKTLATYTGAKHVVTCANGTDALRLCLVTKNLTTNDAVFVPSFTFAATAEVVAELKATPFFVDVDPNTFNICPQSLKQAITQAKKEQLRPAGIIAVDLFGNPADYIGLHEIAQENLWIIADSAQSFGASLHNDKVGCLASLTTTSFFPAKPLGCYGDGGAVFIRDDNPIVEKLTSLRNHGAGEHRYDHIRIGFNSRLDTLQAAILLEKFKIFDDELTAKQAIAARYQQNLPSFCKSQNIDSQATSANAIYTIQIDANKRDALQSYFIEQNVPCPIYYHKPLHMQTVYSKYPKTNLENTERLSQSVLSLPMHAYLTTQHIDYIAEKLQTFE